MKVIHLSDTHVGYRDNDQRLHRVLQDIATHNDPNDTVIVHTGDLNDSGDPELMRQGRALLDALGQKGWRILLAPGNHDCGDAMHVDPEMAGRFFDHFKPYVFGASPAQFPVLTLTEDCAFIGLDTNQAEMSFWERWFAEGFLGQTQIDALDAMLDLPSLNGKKIVLYMHHHPFFDAFAVRPELGDVGYWGHFVYWNTRRFRRLKDAYSLMQCIRDRVDILLFGHQHFGYDYSSEGQRYGIPVALDASSSTCTQMDTQRMRYRIIDTTTSSLKTRFVDNR
jgi:3',5'-cyclic AMP phosphodiesterase CpdA